MGCIESKQSKYIERDPVETLYLQRTISKKVNDIQTGLSKIPAVTNAIGKDITLEKSPKIAVRNGRMRRSFSSGCLFTKFPRWKGYKVCNLCITDEGTDLDHNVMKHRVAKRHCSRCEMVDDITKNMRKNAPSEFSMSVLANLLALTSLDLAAPASDALVKNRKNDWIQLAGHPGSFAPAGPNTIWKRRITKDNTETMAYESLMEDEAHDIVPMFFREVEYNSEYFIEIEDLLQHFVNPNIMDIKIGKRTFLESEVKNPLLRKDLYEKMVSLDPKAPTTEESEQKAITKLRYMQFRERESSTAELGFRIEALRMANEPPKTNLKKVRSREQINSEFCSFLQGRNTIRLKLCEKLKYLRRKFEMSTFFMSHEIIGSSILMIFDNHENAGVWMIDFSKAKPLEEGRTLTHRAEWTLGNSEDGYLTGVDNLIQILGELQCHEETVSKETECKTVQ
ncbi:hypothetical protein FSP39_005074 [Pinctada imbricata]|uniref:Kinase n=1 Tax=Pinctada imbricata TaxID=66713 RepID=A0AA89BPJ1_PINIB|nr:hypothetical protein FSP39_005074 [Pinctada imbricata]